MKKLGMQRHSIPGMDSLIRVSIPKKLLSLARCQRIDYLKELSRGKDVALENEFEVSFSEET